MGSLNGTIVSTRQGNLIDDITAHRKLIAPVRDVIGGRSGASSEKHRQCTDCSSRGSLGATVYEAMTRNMVSGDTDFNLGLLPKERKGCLTGAPKKEKQGAGTIKCNTRGPLFWSGLNSVEAMSRNNGLMNHYT